MVQQKRTYEEFLTMAKGLLDGDSNLVSDLANISALLKEKFDFFWVGFYLSEENGLSLGPFQGPVACTSIAEGKGVCGWVKEHKQAIIVPDVHQFEGHIACSSLTNSEIVLPLFNANEEVMGVLDIDSERLDEFDQNDLNSLEKLLSLISEKHG